MTVAGAALMGSLKCYTEGAKSENIVSENAPGEFSKVGAMWGGGVILETPPYTFNGP